MHAVGHRRGATSPLEGSLSRSKSRLAFALMYAWMALLAAPFLARGPLRTPLGGVAPLAPPCSPRASSSGAAVVTCGARSGVVFVWCWREGGLSDSLPLSPHPKAGSGRGLVREGLEVVVCCGRRLSRGRERCEELGHALGRASSAAEVADPTRR